MCERAFRDPCANIRGKLLSSFRKIEKEEAKQNTEPKKLQVANKPKSILNIP